MSLARRKCRLPARRRSGVSPPEVNIDQGWTFELSKRGVREELARKRCWDLIGEQRDMDRLERTFESLGMRGYRTASIIATDSCFNVDLKSALERVRFIRREAEKVSEKKCGRISVR